MGRGQRGRPEGGAAERQAKGCDAAPIVAWLQHVRASGSPVVVANAQLGPLVAVSSHMHGELLSGGAARGHDQAGEQWATGAWSCK